MLFCSNTRHFGYDLYLLSHGIPLQNNSFYIFYFPKQAMSAVSIQLFSRPRALITVVGLTRASINCITSVSFLNSLDLNMHIGPV